MKQIIRNVQLDFSNFYDQPVLFAADIEIEVNPETGEKIVIGAIAREKNDIFGVEVGQWFYNHTIHVNDII